ncbi:MAG: hypothetical protein ACJ763_01010 [Bdellovibrionia bacterium]
MKDSMTYNLNHLLSTRRGIVCLLALSAFSSIPYAFAGAQDHCASNIIEKIEELSSSRELVPTDRVPTISYRDVINGRIPQFKKTPSFEFQTPDGGFITVLDVSSSKVRDNPNLGRALKIWNIKVEREFRKRLAKFRSYFKNGGKRRLNSLDFPDRTVVILKTKKSLNDGSPSVDSGMRIVFGRNSDEKLPFQQEFSDYNRAEVAAEIGRLYGPGDGPLLLHTGMRVIEQAPEVREVWVHTSWPHAKLYGRMGAKAETADIDVRDPLTLPYPVNVILRFDREKVHGVIDKTKEQMSSSKKQILSQNAS